MSRHRKTTTGHRNPQVLPMLLIGVGLLVLGVVSLLVLAKPGNASSPKAGGDTGPSALPVAVGFVAPQLNLYDLQGNPVALAGFEGQVVLVNNWATWCPPCKAEMPVLQAYYEDHRHKGFTIVAIEAGETREQVADFAEQYGLTFPVWPDPEQQAMEAFHNLNLPNSYLIDRDGWVRLAWTGAISRAMLEKYVTPIIEE